MKSKGDELGDCPQYEYTPATVFNWGMEMSLGTMRQMIPELQHMTILYLHNKNYSL